MHLFRTRAMWGWGHCNIKQFAAWGQTFWKHNIISSWSQSYEREAPWGVERMIWGRSPCWDDLCANSSGRRRLLLCQPMRLRVSLSNNDYNQFRNLLTRSSWNFFGSKMKNCSLCQFIPLVKWHLAVWGVNGRRGGGTVEIHPASRSPSLFKRPEFSNMVKDAGGSYFPNLIYSSKCTIKPCLTPSRTIFLLHFLMSLPFQIRIAVSFSLSLWIRFEIVRASITPLSSIFSSLLIQRGFGPLLSYFESSLIWWAVWNLSLAVFHASMLQNVLWSIGACLVSIIK